MKSLKCHLLSICFASQLTAQVGIQLTAHINLRLDSIAPATADFVIFERDTLKLARLCAYANYFQSSDQLLTSYNAVHNALDGLSFHAQVLYWMQEFDRSIAVYEKTIRLYPGPSPLYLDYARVLYGSGRHAKAQSLLAEYRSIDSTNVEADIMTGYMHLWNGELELAGKKATTLLQHYPENAQAKDILGKISEYTTPYYKTGIEFLSDDQPLKGKVFYVEAGLYKSWLVAPTAQIAYYQYRAGDTPFHASWVQLSNTIQYKIANSLRVKAGVFRQNSQRSAITANISYSRKILSDFLLNASFERRPYQYTTSSLNNMVMENASAISVDYNRKNKWLGKAGYESLSYKDGNKIKTGYLWVLATVLSHPRYTIRVGYSFHYSDAIHNNFVPTLPIQQLVDSQKFENLDGLYHPYFTPENQKMHSALARTVVSLSKKIQFTSRINVGIVAQSDNPYIWLDEPGGDFKVFRGYTQVNFTPVTWVNELRWAASSRCSLATTYTYDKLLYYKNHRGGIELKYLFLK